MGEVFEKRTFRGWMHYERPWPIEQRCEWCFTREAHEKHKAQLKVQLSDNEHGKQHAKLCLCCWFRLAFTR